MRQCVGANVLDLHHLSRGAAQLAVRWWIGQALSDVLRVTVRHFWRISDISALPTLVLDGLVKWMPAWSHLQFLYKLKFLQILKDHERSKRATGCARAASVCPSALLHHHHRIPEGCPKGKHSIWVADSQGCLLKAFLWELHSAGKQRRSCDPKSCFRPACCGLSFS